MVWSFVYLALRRVLELMALASGRRTPGRWRFWSSVTSWPSCTAGSHGLGSSPRPCAACGPQPPAAQALMVDLHGHARDAASMAPLHGASALDLSSAGTRPATVPQQVQTLIVRPATETHGEATSAPAGSCWALAARSPPAPSPGSCAPTASRGERPSRRWHPLIRPSRNCSGSAWSGRGVHDHPGATGLRPAGSGVTWVRQ
jgi:hypothetical protein